MGPDHKPATLIKRFAAALALALVVGTPSAAAEAAPEAVIGRLNEAFRGSSS